MRDLLRRYLTPTPLAVRRREQAILDRGRPLHVDAGPGAVVCTVIGGSPGGDAVLLVHGWSGGPGQLTRIADALVDDGHTVVVAEMPGHGRTAAWADDGTANFGQFATAIRAVDAAVGGCLGVVAHSGGSLATLMAMEDGLRVGRLVALAGLSRLRQSAEGFLDRAGASQAQRVALDRGMRDRFGDDVWRWTDGVRIASTLTHQPEQVALVHDVDDAQVPVAEAEALHAAWQPARLHRTERLGHHLVLRADPALAEIRRVLAR